jgi:L-alanine-DL-glutamate epimerase-like enolase superfamily enzyme
MLKIPEKPGLGLDLNRDAVAKYTHGERLFD